MLELNKRTELTDRTIFYMTNFSKKIFMYFLIAFFIVVMGAPFLWMFLTSFKASNEVITYPLTWLPSKIHYENYIKVFQRVPFGRFYFNSTLVTVTVTLSELFFASLTGFAFAKYKFKGKNLIFILILSGMMIPFQLKMIPIYLFLNNLNWLDSYKSLIVPFIVTPYGVFLMRQFIQELPDELIEASRLDGCSEFGIFMRIILPMCKPPLAALTIITFMRQWNSFLWPLIVIDRVEMRTVQLGLAIFQEQHGVLQYNQLMAASVIVLLPILVVFLSAQKYFIEGIAIGGIKG